MNNLERYADRRRFGDSTLSEIKSKIAEAMGYQLEDLQIAPDHLDKTEATDLIHIPSGMRFAVRTRKMEDKKYYYGQFTVRLSSCPCELDKLEAVKDSGRYYIFYAFVDSGQVDSWWLFGVNDAAFAQPQEEVERPGMHFLAFAIPKIVTATSEAQWKTQQPPPAQR